MLNAGRYDKRVKIIKVTTTYDKSGYPQETSETVLEAYARVKTTRGWTLIASGSDFEAATTNFTIRYPQTVDITRDMRLEYAGKTYTIEYLNNVDERGVELEIQAKLVVK